MQRIGQLHSLGRENEVRKMREYFHHGGRVAAAQLAFPDAPLPWIDLSTGLNPHPYPTAGLDIDWAPLPDEGQRVELEGMAAVAFGLGSLRPCAVPGTEIGLRLLTELDLPGPVHIVSPSYGSYRDAWPNAWPIDAPIAGPGTLVLANPNNPDGQVRAAPEMVKLARQVASTGGTLVIDEAFVDATPEASLLPHLADLDPEYLIILRSFGKFYGLGGLRLGFVICGERRMQRLRHRLGSWPLSTAAIVIGSAAYRDRAWADDARARLRAAAQRLDQLLARHGLAAAGDCPLFRLVTHCDAGHLFVQLARQGILTRPFDYAPTWLRFGLPGSEQAWARLDRALGAACG